MPPTSMKKLMGLLNYFFIIVRQDFIIKLIFISNFKPFCKISFAFFMGFLIFALESLSAHFMYLYLDCQYLILRYMLTYIYYIQMISNRNTLHTIFLFCAIKYCSMKTFVHPFWRRILCILLLNRTESRFSCIKIYKYIKLLWNNYFNVYFHC